MDDPSSGHTLGPMVRFPPMVDGEPLTVSATLYLTYRRCPRQALARVRGIYPDDTVASFRGGLAHRVFARHLTAGPISDERFEQVCREEIGTGMNVTLSAVGLGRPSRLRRVIDEVGELYRRFRDRRFDGFVAAEVELEADAGSSVLLRGRIDAVFDEPVVRIVDWKTGRITVDAEEQLAFYGVLWAMARGSAPASVEAVSVATGERFAVDIDADRLTATVTEVAAMVDDLRAALVVGAEGRARAGPWCGYCPVLDRCDEGRSAAAVIGGR